MRLWKKLVVFFSVIVFSLVSSSSSLSGDLAIINQKDPAFKTNEYKYNGHYFWENGCGPASIANALIAGLGITDEETAAKILLDVLNTMSSNHKEYTINLNNYTYLATHGRVLPQLYEQGGWKVVCYKVPVTYETLVSLTNDNPILIFSKAKNESYWETVFNYIKALKETSATIYIVRIGAGTSSVSGPLAQGQAGHYITLAIPVNEFLVNGSIYLLDSMPCALTGEPYGSKEYYHTRYPFVSNPRGHKKFLDTYGIERVSPEIIRFYLLEPEGTNRLDAAKQFVLYGSFFWLIVIP